MYAWLFVPLTVLSFAAISLCTHVVAWKLEPIFLDSCFRIFSDLKLMLNIVALKFGIFCGYMSLGQFN